LQPRYFALDCTANVLCRAVNRNSHLCVFSPRANLTRRMKAHGDFAERRIGLRVAGTCPKANGHTLDVRTKRAQR
jgi:hypothetical protein